MMGAARARRSRASEASIKALLTRLEGAPAAELRALWRAQRGVPPPGTFTARLLRLSLAWEAQQAGQGAKMPDRVLQRVAARRAAGARPAEAVSGLKPPPVPVGTRLMRDWGGTMHEVIVLAEGVLWQGRTWSSLSVVARQITGSPRNGPRFFGLRSQA